MKESELKELEQIEIKRGCSIKKIRGKNEDEADKKFYKFTDKFDVNIHLLTVRRANKNKVVYKVYYS